MDIEVQVPSPLPKIQKLWDGSTVLRPSAPGFWSYLLSFKGDAKEHGEDQVPSSPDDSGSSGMVDAIIDSSLNYEFEASILF